MPMQSEHDPRLKPALKTRHISMLALGGVIGAGLFVGSSSVIASTGPAAFLSYAITGVMVVAIIAFLVVTLAYVFRLWPGSTASFGNLTAHGGFLPHGPMALFSGVVSVIFSMTGVEVATIAAAESDNPARNIRQAVNTVMARILVFFVLATLFIVILVAVMSVLNAGLYTASRLLAVLGECGEAPAWMSATNRRGVPAAGVLVSTLVGYACVVIAALWPTSVFQFLLDSSGAVFLFAYLMICLSQLKLRRRWVREGTLRFRMWLHPWLPLAVTASIVAVLVSMGWNPATRLSLIQCLIAIGVIVLSYGVLMVMRRMKRMADASVTEMAAAQRASATDGT